MNVNELFDDTCIYISCFKKLSLLFQTYFWVIASTYFYLNILCMAKSSNTYQPFQQFMKKLTEVEIFMNQILSFIKF